MNKYKESRNNILTQTKYPDKNYINNQKFRLGRLKSQENINNKLNKIDIKTIHTKNNLIYPSLNKNMIKNNNIKKLSKNSIVEMMNKHKFQMKKQMNFMNTHNTHTTKFSKRFSKNKDIFIEQGNDVGSSLLNKTIYDDIKMRNIINLWNELEVMESYRKYFFFIYNELGEDDKNNFYHNEINELIQLKNDIKNLAYNIELRMGIINKLLQFNDDLNKENEKGKIEQNTINEMIKKMEDLTIQTINIIKYMQKIKTVINIEPNLGKYYMDIISQKFNFDKNYLIKMKFETDFLKEGYAKNIFDIKNQETPFFINVKDKNKYTIPNDENNLKSISLDQKYINDMIDCDYFIYKELIAYENEKAYKKIMREISPIRKNTSAYNFYTNINFYTHEFIKNQENKNEKIFFPIQNRKSLLNNIYTNSYLNTKKNFITCKKMNNSDRKIKTSEFYNDDFSNNNKKNNIINSKKIKKMNNLIKFHGDFERNKLINKRINSSGMILSKKNHDLKIIKKYNNSNNIEKKQNNYNEKSKENKSNSKE